MPEIRLAGVHKSLGGRRVLDGLDLLVRDGELLALLGPSGAGKTTMLKLVAGLLSADSGEVLVDGRSVSSYGRSPAVMVFQDYRLFPHMTVEENVAFGLRVRGQGRRAFDAARDMLGRLQLSGLEGRFPSELSGGQAQRVALARALVVQPEILLLDEPFANLDPALKEELRELLRGMRSSLGFTSILVAHDQRDAFALADRVAVMLSGRIVQVESPANLCIAPAGPEVEALVGHASVISAVAHPTHLDCPLGRWPAEMLAPQYRDLLARATASGPAPVRIILRQDSICVFPDEGGRHA